MIDSRNHQTMDMEDVVNAAFEFSEKLIAEADERLFEIITGESSEDVYLTAPEVVIMLLERAVIFCETFYDRHRKIRKLSWLGRVSIFPSADWAITLYHKDYAQTKENWMIVKLAISPIKLKVGKCERQIIYLNELISKSKERIELN